MSVTWEEWKRQQEYEKIPVDFEGTPVDLERCEIEGCKKWCVTLTRCADHLWVRVEGD